MATFENIVRPLIGDMYDTAFPARRTDVQYASAALDADERHMVVTLVELYLGAACLKNTDARDKARQGMVSAMKSIRKSAELRHQKEDATAKRGAARYRYRAIAPDGAEVLFPARGTKRLGRGCALIYRGIPKPADQIKASVEAHYARHLSEASSEAHAALIREAVARDIETEIAIQNKYPSEWSVWDWGWNRSAMERQAARFANEYTDRYHDECLVVEGTPFEVE